jgi:elongation factor Ts
MTRIEAIKEFRNITGMSLLASKNLVEEAELDVTKAIELARKEGLLSFTPKSNIPTSQGSVGIYIAEDGKLGAIIELKCQTDFAAKTKEFTDTAYKIARHIAETYDRENQTHDELSFMLDLIRHKVKEEVVLGRYEVFNIRGKNA